ncbi:hypothetical protein KZY98_10035 [Croceibacter atlanticus]|jgi:hypothetical protein|uniref:hypothetical protein n=1 Tax=Croceibacter atlanticus TaxID=313588 RepID=UPI001C5D14B7|nr:hypothetical protein [Croceibacter atlanticus]MBW4970797.1 hypothetical protein [Croceibacter atlanticus]
MKILRACIFPKDVHCLTGRSERYGRKLLKDIRVHFDKAPHQFITVEEFAEYSGINKEIITEYLRQVS